MVFEEFPGTDHSEPLYFKRWHWDSYLQRDVFCFAVPDPILFSLASELYAFSISFSVHFKQASHIPQKEERAWGWLFWQDAQHRDLPLPLALIFCMFLSGNWTQKGHLASWQLQEAVGVGNIKQKQTIDMRTSTLGFCFSSSFFRRD